MKSISHLQISKIQEFGTPEEVAARVVTAEVNRDGVFKVTPAKDPKEDTSGEANFMILSIYLMERGGPNELSRGFMLWMDSCMCSRFSAMRVSIMK